MAGAQDQMAAARADLVLTMTRQHRRAVLQTVPRALNKTFTLREAADVLEQLGPGAPGGADRGEQARALVRRMASSRSRRTNEDDDDVPDPINRPLEAHQEAGSSSPGG